MHTFRTISAPRVPPGLLAPVGFPLALLPALLSTLVLVLVLVLPVSPALGQDAERRAESRAEGGDGAALERLRTTMAAALEAGPARRVEDRALAAEATGIRAEVQGEPLTASLQREGLGFDLEAQPNALTVLGLELSVSTPAQARARRDLAGGLETWLATAGRRAAWEVATEAGRRWLAAAEARGSLDLAQRRFERLDRALELQRVRFEVGEVAGIEVTMVELERAAARRQVEEQRARFDAALAVLVEWAGAGAPVPEVGDLASLAGRALGEGTPSVEAGGSGPSLDGIPATSPRWRAARDRAERERLAAAAHRALAGGRPTLSAGWEHGPSLAGQDSFDALVLGVSVPLPFGEAVERRRRAATARAEEAAARRDAEGRRLAAELVGLEARLAAARRTLEESRDAWDGLERAEHSLTEQFRLGAISYLAFIDGLARLEEAGRHLLATRHSLVEARLELVALLGRDDPFAPPLPPLADAAAQGGERP